MGTETKTVTVTICDRCKNEKSVIEGTFNELPGWADVGIAYLDADNPPGKTMRVGPKCLTLISPAPKKPRKDKGTHRKEKTPSLMELPDSVVLSGANSAKKAPRQRHSKQGGASEPKQGDSSGQNEGKETPESAAKWRAENHLSCPGCSEKNRKACLLIGISAQDCWESRRLSLT